MGDLKKKFDLLTSKNSKLQDDISCREVEIISSFIKPKAEDKLTSARAQLIEMIINKYTNNYWKRDEEIEFKIYNFEKSEEEVLSDTHEILSHLLEFRKEVIRNAILLNKITITLGKSGYHIEIDSMKSRKSFESLRERIGALLIGMPHQWVLKKDSINLKYHMTNNYLKNVVRDNTQVKKSKSIPKQVRNEAK